MVSELNLNIDSVGTKIGLVDANLLLLEVSNRCGLNRFVSFERLKEFRHEDAVLLKLITRQFHSLGTTSYVLAEVSNLANKLSGQLRAAWFTELSSFALVTDEKHIPTKLLGERDETVRFGVADSALSELALSHVIVTTDFRLSNYLESLGRDVINFNHLRLTFGS